MTPAYLYRHPGIAGNGAIATGLAALCAVSSDTTVLVRSQGAVRRAADRIGRLCEKIDGADFSRVSITTDDADLASCDVVVEAIVENLEIKSDLLRRIDAVAAESDIATTTSSLKVSELARLADIDRLFGLHVFNPVPKMDLIEVCIPNGDAGTRSRALAWCDALGKTGIEVPDQVGFVVNRLLFPYLFDGVRMLEETGMQPPDVDACMKLGTGHPMGPLELLDFVGLDVALAIGISLFNETGNPAHSPPDTILALVKTGKLGRKSNEGFYDYEP
jgi:3-hydroxyacyl-CoA dehydrogenase